MANVGRHEKEIDFAKLKMLAEAGCNLTSCADQLDCHRITLGRRVKKEYGINFATYSSQARSKGLADLKAIIHHRATGKVSSKGSVQLLLFLAKYELGMNDFELERQVKARHEKGDGEAKKSTMQQIADSSKEMARIHGAVAEPKPQAKDEEDV